jgi:hypothetical protein
VVPLSGPGPIVFMWTFSGDITRQTLARWCRIRGYLESAANHGLNNAIDAISAALAGKPELPAARPTITVAARNYVGDWTRING